MRDTEWGGICIAAIPMGKKKMEDKGRRGIGQRGRERGGRWPELPHGPLVKGTRSPSNCADRFSTAGMNISISRPVSRNCGEHDFFGRNARIRHRISSIDGICATEET